MYYLFPALYCACTYCVSTVYEEMPYFTFSSIFHERLNGQFSLFPLKRAGPAEHFQWGQAYALGIISPFALVGIGLVYLPKLSGDKFPLSP